MRRTTRMTALVLGLALAVPAWAQTAVELKKELLPKIKKAQADGKDLGVAAKEYEEGDKAMKDGLQEATGVCLVPERDPLLTAHQVATLDLLSGGRFLFGVGAGWLREEMDLLTPHFPHRFAFLREAIMAMRKLWTEERPSFEGRWVRFPPVVCRPKPVQKPHPPVILGGMGPNARKRVAAWGDGWLPIGLPPDDVAEARREISRRALEHDRDPEAISLTVMIGAPPGLETPSLETIPDRDTLARYRDAGADRVVVSLPTLGADDAYRHLDRLASAAP